MRTKKKTFINTSLLTCRHSLIQFYFYNWEKHGIYQQLPHLHGHVLSHMIFCLVLIAKSRQRCDQHLYLKSLSHILPNLSTYRDCLDISFLTDLRLWNQYWSCQGNLESFYSKTVNILNNASGVLLQRIKSVQVHDNIYEKWAAICYVAVNSCDQYAWVHRGDKDINLSKHTFGPLLNSV